MMPGFFLFPAPGSMALFTFYQCHASDTLDDLCGAFDVRSTSKAVVKTTAS